MSLSPRKIREREARKEEILTAAREVFFEKGFYSSTMEEIAHRAGFSKGAIYFYFKSKEEILIHINCNLMDTFQETLNNLISQEHSLEQVTETLLDNLQILFKTFLNRLDALVYFTPGNHPLNIPKELEERWSNGLLSILNIFQGLLDKAPGQKSRVHEDSLQYALFILSMGLGLFQLSKVRSETLREKIDMQAQFDILGEIILKALVKK